MTPDAFESRVRKLGHQLLEAPQGKSILSQQGLRQKLFDQMLQNRQFRIAMLRFTDVAPVLSDDTDFVTHLQAYFEDQGGLEGLLGESIGLGKMLPGVVAPLVRSQIRAMAQSFIAGETIEDALPNLKLLHQDGICSTVDLLGEAVLTKSEAEGFTQSYHKALKRLSQEMAGWPTSQAPEFDRLGVIVRANVSVKLSALYEHVDPANHQHSVDVLVGRLSALLDTAMATGAYIHIDAEQYSLLPITMEVFQRVLLDTKYINHPHIGIVLQTYLKDADPRLRGLIKLAKDRGTPFSIRLVKGAYWDYEQAHAERNNWPCPVFDHKEETDLHYERLTDLLLANYPLVRPCIGGHNARSIAVAIATAEKYGLDKADVEFQMLYGMAEHFRDAVRDMGYRVRQYCPIGAFIPGMSYLVRRLLENTANQSFLAQSTHEQDPATLLVPPQAPQFKKAKATPDFMNRAPLDWAIAENRQRADTALKKWLKSAPWRIPAGVNGQNIMPKNGEVKKHYCPWATSLETTHFVPCTTHDGDAAITAAGKGYRLWADWGAHRRAEILEKAAEIMEWQWESLFALQVYEAGKNWREADGDISEAIDFLHYYAQQIRHLDAQFQPQSVWSEDNKTIYEPRGVVAVIAPWNFPLAISCGMVSAALAAGNAVVYKPSEQTTAIGRVLYDALIEAGVPKDVLHFLPGEGSVIGAHMVAHPEVAGIAFTGSKDVGLRIYETAGKTLPHQLQTKKCVIEMGGKNAVIIDNDADLDEAVPAVVYAAFGFQGQKCSAASRVIVVGSHYEAFIARLQDMVNELRVGPADNPYFNINAVIDLPAYDKINKIILQGKKECKLVAQAQMPEGGFYIPPTVFADVPQDHSLTQEEIFGPVLCVYRAKTIDEAVKMALGVPFALTGALFSRNPKTIAVVKEKFRVGNLYINRGCTGAMVGRQPFGGGKMSGTGTKAGGPDYLLNFLEARVMTENTMRRGFAPKDKK